MKKTGFLLIVFLFIFGSICGWVLEVFYRKIPSEDNPEGKWKNPGLLSGPWLPIYGFGVVFLYFVTAIGNYLNLNSLQFIIYLFFGSAVIMSSMELVGGSFLYNVMHMRLWDYRKQKFNYKGYTCAKFFCIWGSVSVAYYYVISKPVIKIVDKYLSNIDIFAYFIGILWGFFLIDLWNSMGISIKIAKYAKDHNIYIDFEKVKDEARVSDKVNSNSKKERIFTMPNKDNVIYFIEKSIKKVENIPSTIKDKIVEPVEEKVEEVLQELKK